MKERQSHQASDFLVGTMEGNIRLTRRQLLSRLGAAGTAAIAG